MDAEWIRELSRAEFDGKHWQVSNPEAMSARAEKHLLHAISDLHRELQRAVQVFNDFRTKDRGLQLLSLEERGQQVGLMLLLGPIQLRIERQAGELICARIVRSQFRRAATVLFILKVQYDPLGDIIWQDDHGQLYTYEWMAKVLLKELVKSQQVTQ